MPKFVLPVIPIYALSYFQFLDYFVTKLHNSFKILVCANNQKKKDTN